MNTVLLVGFCCLLTVASRIPALEIIPPYPKNEIAIEGDSLKISCTARDTSGYPRKVVFTRRSRIDQYTYDEMKNSPRVYVTNTTRNETQGFTRTAVLHFNSVQPSDHYSLAPYQCWAYPAGQGSIEKHVFTLYVISKSDLPRATVKSINATLGRPAILKCEVVSSGNANTAPLQSLAWTKNNKTIKNGSTSIDPLIFNAVSARNGGIYTCMAVVKLQASKKINMPLGTAILNIRVQFFEAPTKVVVTEGGEVVLECPAEGYPLNIMWLRKLKNGTQVALKDAINTSVAKRYVATRPCSYCRYKLTISNFQSHDAGRYVCKANEGGQHHFDLLLSDSTIEPTAAGCLGAMVNFHTVIVVVLVGLMLIL